MHIDYVQERATEEQTKTKEKQTKDAFL